MTLKEIKTAVDNNKKVYWINRNYLIIKDSIEQYLIHSQCNDNYQGLTCSDGVTLNGEEHEFKTSEDLETA